MGKMVFFSLSDAFFLAAIMRLFKPKRIVEVGSGFSSAVMIDVNERFFKDSVDLLFIEPNPGRLNSLVGKEGKFNIKEEKIQKVDFAVFESLEQGDILFIDSSHVGKVGSDVNHIFFKVLPRLRPGVLIHFHDILYPFEYPKDWIYDGIYWNEAYFLKTFLMYNNEFQIQLFVDYLLKFHKNWFQEFIPGYNVDGGSIWITKK